jgi:hypothetical protein
MERGGRKHLTTPGVRSEKDLLVDGPGDASNFTFSKMHGNRDDAFSERKEANKGDEPANRMGSIEDEIELEFAGCMYPSRHHPWKSEHDLNNFVSSLI